MRWTLAFVCATVGLAACASDETVAAYGAADKVWHLQSIDGVSFSGEATLEFGADGRVSGKAPCNRWFGQQTAPYPWFEVSAVGATKMACPDLAAESAFFTALQEMSLSEISGEVLLLSNDAGQSMVFTVE